MSTQPALFDAEPIPLGEPELRESATVRRTKRQAAFLERGRHPLSSPMGISLFLHPEAAPAGDRDAPGRRCGNCRFRQLVRPHDRIFPKCYLPSPTTGRPFRDSNSEATDVRAWWPGCKDHEWGDGRMSPDAARCVPEAVTA